MLVGAGQGAVGKQSGYGSESRKTLPPGACSSGHENGARRLLSGLTLRSGDRDRAFWQNVLDHVPRDARRILDLGTGDGRLLALLRMDRPDSARFADQASVEFVRHDLAEPMPDLGSFDAVVSCLAIQHVHDTRKRTLYAEALRSARARGVFCNLPDVETQLGWAVPSRPPPAR